MSYCKFYKEKEQVSYNSGQTWSDIPGTYRKGDLYELDSPDCSPIPINRKWTAIKDTISIVKDCDSSSSITSSDLSGGLSFNYFIVGNCVKNIDDYVFFDIGYERRNMFSSLTIGENVENIGTCAFMMCGSLTSLYIPDSVTSIGSEAFRDCSGLTTIRIGSGLTEIGHGVFTSCMGLTSIGVTGSGASVEIPNNIRTISSQCFDCCSGLTSINMPSSVTSIGSNAFNNCTNLTSAVIPDSVTSIGSFAFANCSNLPNVSIPNGITIISNSMFQGCISLSSIVIPSSITSIERQAFLGATSLTSITVNATTPPSLGNNVFYNTPIDSGTGTIYVPSTSVNVYKSAWSDYSSRIQAIP